MVVVQKKSLFSRGLTRYLEQKFEGQAAAIMRATQPELLTYDRVQEGITPFAVPELLRGEVGFDPPVVDDEDMVMVRMKVPVTGDLDLLECVPEGLQPLRLAVKVTDDLLRCDELEGSGYRSDRFDKPAPSGRSGFIVSETFTSSVTPDEVRGWAGELLDRIEAYLPAMRREVDEHELVTRSALGKRAAARRKALTTASRLNDQLGTGL